MLCVFFPLAFDFLCLCDAQAIEHDFVACRRGDPKVREEYLHHRLTLMRLLNASYLREGVEMNILKKIQVLEKKRQSRN